jgi:predicted AAA+ superfamily ATPase
METVSRFINEPEGSFFLFGPRGTGKSTWLRQRFPDALVLDFLDPALFRMCLARPERVREIINGNPHRRDVVIDEVQKIPETLDVVHQMMEERRGIRFILTGSSARKLKRGAADLLAGRALLGTCHPFMASELGRRFNLDDALCHGMVPVIFSSPDRAGALQAYVSLYVREEVREEGLVRNLSAFTRFLEAAALSHASLLSVSEIARECSAERKNVESYLGVLEDILLAFRIPVFSRRAKRLLVSHSKFYFFDPGVFGALRPAGPLDRPGELAGAALEGLVAQQLRAWLAYSGETGGLHFWRTKAGLEVDFVIYTKDCLAALEVKNSASVSSADLRGLKSFRDDYPEAGPLILLHRGAERLMTDGILCVPAGDFLSALIPGRPLPR